MPTALARDPSTRMANMKSKYFERIEDDTGANTFPTCYLPNRLSNPSTECSSISCSQLYIKNNSRAAPITNKVTNSSAERLPPHQIPNDY